jgi:OOP family OmpA-OmpF porin
MRKIILSGLVASAILTSAVAEEFYITPTIGKVIRESSELEKDSIFGVRVGMPTTTTYVTDTVELAYDRQNSVGYNGIADSTSINRLSGNALKHYKHFKEVTPYGLVGLGFEHIVDDKLSTDDSLFVNIGAGVKYKLQNNMSLMTDVRHIIRFDEFDSHTVWNIGLVIPFGAKKTETKVVIAEKKVEPIVETKIIAEIKPEPAIVKVAPLDSDKDGIIDELDKCPTSHMGAKVDANGCCLDSDKDGVKDFADKCPNTPAGFAVDASGCEISYNLKINFDTNKANIKPEYENDIAKFVVFMKTFGNYKAEIQGYTDNRGNAKLNKSLSQKRADSLKAKFVHDGISADRLTAIGYGEEKPVASNDTTEGQNANRRIDMNLSK